MNTQFEEIQNRRKKNNIIYAYKDEKNKKYYYAFGKIIDRDLDITIKQYMDWWYKVTPIAERVLGGPYEYDGRFAVLYKSDEELDFSLFCVQVRWVDTLEELDEYRDIE